MPTDEAVSTALDKLKNLDSLTFLRWLLKVELSDKEKSFLHHAGLIDADECTTEFGRTIVDAINSVKLS